MKSKTPFLSCFILLKQENVCIEYLEAEFLKLAEVAGIDCFQNSCAWCEVVKVHFKSCWKVFKGLGFSRCYLVNPCSYE